ncbi:MAG: AraC family transcriptional regulator [Prolixibacteraceae bacterium]|nr:AraC family transcriptional regulator [Prolixibacteraceae bacterium]
MKLHFKYDINHACKVIVQESLNKLGVPHQVTGLGEISVTGTLSPEIHNELKLSIRKYGIEFIDDPKKVIAQQIKDLICNMVFKDDELPDLKISAYLSDKLNLNYGYLSKLFSEVTYSTIENFIILQRIERAKQLIIDENLTLNEVAWKLNYSSSAHLSNQFKRTTGLTPTQFQRIIHKRKSIVNTLNNI